MNDGKETLILENANLSINASHGQERNNLQKIKKYLDQGYRIEFLFIAQLAFICCVFAEII